MSNFGFWLCMRHLRSGQEPWSLGLFDAVLFSKSFFWKLIIWSHLELECGNCFASERGVRLDVSADMTKFRAEPGDLSTTCRRYDSGIQMSHCDVKNRQLLDYWIRNASWFLWRKCGSCLALRHPCLRCSSEGAAQFSAEIAINSPRLLLSPPSISLSPFSSIPSYVLASLSSLFSSYLLSQLQFSWSSYPSSSYLRISILVHSPSTSLSRCYSNLLLLSPPSLNSPRSHPPISLSQGCSISSFHLLVSFLIHLLISISPLYPIVINFLLLFPLSQFSSIPCLCVWILLNLLLLGPLAKNFKVINKQT